MRSCLTLLLLLATLASAAHARDGLRDLIHPRAALPAFRCVVPAEWADTIDAAGNLSLANEERTANFSFSLVRTPEPAERLDQLAKVLLAGAVSAPWESREPAEISGHRGFRYVARLKHTNGVIVRVDLVLVAAGPDHIASAALFLNEKVKPADETQARLVFAAARLIPTP